MSDEKVRHSSEKSRQELLDELYYVKDVAGEREQRIQRLQALIAEKDAALAEKDAALAEKDATLAERDASLAETRSTLGLMISSRSWRWMAPLRAVTRLFGAMRGRSRVGASSSSDLANDEQPTTMTAPVITAPRTAESEPAAADAGGPLGAEHEGPPRLFVDTSELAIRVGQTGVQRVVREVLRALLENPPTSYTVEPVFAAPGQSYRHARTFVARLTGSARPSESEPTMQPRAGDVFLGLDHSMQAVAEHASEFEAMHRDGVSIYFVCNDTLPLSRPDCFPYEVHEAFKTWLETIAKVADGIVCISRATESELRHWLDTLQPSRERPLALGHFHLGADIVHRETDAAAIASEQTATLERLQGLSSFLMVGTVEPRKAHAQALEAFESLWARGKSVALVLVGLPGWMTEVTQRRIRHHDELGKRLFWLMEADDALLEKLYATCTALLMPSEGEGFGLPIIEAARHGLPILCRDLPVFHEVAGAHASYFTGNDAASLADAVEHWLASHRNGTAPVSTDMATLTWAQSTQQLLHVVLGDHWDESWPSPGITNKKLQHP